MRLAFGTKHLMVVLRYREPDEDELEGISLGGAMIEVAESEEPASGPPTDGYLQFGLSPVRSS